VLQKNLKLLRVFFFQKKSWLKKLCTLGEAKENYNILVAECLHFEEKIQMYKQTNLLKQREN